MYPKSFIEWIGRKEYYIIENMGWYVWPVDEQQEIFICKTVEQLFEIYKENNPNS